MAVSRWALFAIVSAMLGSLVSSLGRVSGRRLGSSAAGRRVVKMVATSPAPKLQDQLSAAGASAAIVAATAAVNAAVGMRDISAPEVDKDRSFVKLDAASEGRRGVVDEVGLPLIYDQVLIAEYWKKQSGALSSRWSEFLQVSVPFLTRVIAILIGSGAGELKVQSASLARDARERMERLGPTYIKLGQMMSVRPDVLPEEALNELKILQDNVKGFDSAVAIGVIESELGGKLSDFFSEISQEPVAAASLAQVYRATLRSTGEVVAVKVQRPGVLETVSKDLYVLRRAAEVYQGLVERFAPQQRTNYVALLNEWAVGFYTELDFKNEGANQIRMKAVLESAGCDGVYVPKVYDSLSTRRVLISEWIDGKKLSDCSPEDINSLIPEAQEAFLTQLLAAGFMHSDPHPGNLMRMDQARGRAQLALLDFGLVAQVKQQDMDTMVSCIIHLANQDYASLVDDFIALEILPRDCDRAKVIPLMNKALTPYVKGGGAQSYEKELKKIYKMDGSLSGTAGGFQAMTQDALTVLNDIPFSIPAYFALLGRAIVTLEGIALTGNPSYGIILEAYPFVARKLLKEDRPAIQRALQEVLYGSDKGKGGMSATRLVALLQNALGSVSRDAGAFIDLDATTGELSPTQAIKLLLGPQGRSLRNGLLLDEAVTVCDLLLRQNTRKTFAAVVSRLPRPPFFASLLPRPETLRLPFLIPAAAASAAAPGPSVVPASSSSSSSSSSSFAYSAATTATATTTAAPQLRPVLATAEQVLDAAAPRLSREEELYALALVDAGSQALGGDGDARAFLAGDLVTEPAAVLRFVLGFAQTGRLGAVSGGLLGGGATDVLTALRGALATAKPGGSGGSGGSAEIMAALRDLTADESRELDLFASSVSAAVQSRLVDRLQVLLLPK